MGNRTSFVHVSLHEDPAHWHVKTRVNGQARTSDWWERPPEFAPGLLDDDDCKVKRISVKAGARLSYQRHAQRAEHWYVVRGMGRVTLDGTVIDVAPGTAVDIPVGSAHRMSNTGDDDLVFVEVQSGSYFGEDDIERLEDDFGRTTHA